MLQASPSSEEGELVDSSDSPDTSSHTHGPSLKSTTLSTKQIDGDVIKRKERLVQFGPPTPQHVTKASIAPHLLRKKKSLSTSEVIGIFQAERRHLKRMSVPVFCQMLGGKVSGRQSVIKLKRSDSMLRLVRAHGMISTETGATALVGLINILELDNSRRYQRMKSQTL